MARRPIWLMFYTGFRMSDATLFSIKWLQGDQVFVRAKKNGGDVFAYVPEWLPKIQCRDEGRSVTRRGANRSRRRSARTAHADVAGENHRAFVSEAVDH